MWSACVEPVLGGSPRVGTHDCRPCVSDSACPSHLLGVSRPYGTPTLSVQRGAVHAAARDPVCGS